MDAKSVKRKLFSNRITASRRTFGNRCPYRSIVICTEAWPICSEMYLMFSPLLMSRDAICVAEVVEPDLSQTRAHERGLELPLNHPRRVIRQRRNARLRQPRRSCRQMYMSRRF